MSALSDHMARGSATVCRAWVVRRQDGAVFGFTDHDGAVEVEGIACSASSGLTAGALQAGTGLAVDNVQAQGALSHEVIREDDIRAGLWDGADVTAYLLNWSEPSQFEILFRGTIGEISWGEGAFTAELRGLAEALNRVRGRVYQARCDAVLGDSRCRKLLGPRFTAEADVVSSEAGQTIELKALDGYAPKWFERGRLRVLTGQAAGQSERIKTDRVMDGGRRIGLWQSLRLGVAAGDRVRLEAGCDKSLETCRVKFDNVANFRGFPNIPGEDWLMAYPVSSGRNDGGRL